jgi:poly(A) polymerase
LTDSVAAQAVAIPRSDHSISRSLISPGALRVLYGLKDAGYRGCLVGGGVRDLLLGREPKDFDVATDALPDEVKQIFRSCRLIGRRFRLAHVRHGREVIEVATFRAAHDAGNGESGDGSLNDAGRILRDNVYGSIEEDAMRRDFSVNALYYDIADFSVLDYAGGMQDLQAGLLRLIGDPEQRYREDPVRLLRAVRFAAKLGFRIHPDTEAPMTRMGDLLADMPPARLFEEILKLFLGGYALNTFELLRHYDLFRHLFPATDAALAQQDHEFPLVMVSRALANTDARLAEDKPVTPAFLYAALLWEPVRLAAQALEAKGASPLEALQIAGSRITVEQGAVTSLPKRFSYPMREIWMMQPRFERRRGRAPYRLLEHPRFRAAYDFLLLRAESGEAPEDTAHWWTDFQQLNTEQQTKLTETGAGQKKGSERKRRRRRRKKPDA